MPTRAELERIQFEAMADDIAIDMETMSLWTEEQAKTYFESGGTVAPPPPDPRAASAAAKERGTAHLKAGEFALAIAAYREALSLGPEDEAALHSNLSLALLKAGDAEGAAAAAEASVALKPRWHKAHYRLGDACFERRDYAKARDAFGKAAELADGDAEVAAALRLATEAAKGGLWLQQLRPGHDIALHPTTQLEALVFGAAKQMSNLIYLVGDLTTRECYVVDACWDCKGIHSFARRHRMKIVGAIASHYHFDHTGGLPPASLRSMVFGPFEGGKDLRLPGLHEMARDFSARVYVHALEVQLISNQCQLEEKELVPLQDGQLLPVGAAGVLEVFHTPGHSGGSICLCIRKNQSATTDAAVALTTTAGTKAHALMVGDTIFPGSCGRLDLPDSNINHMFETMQKLRELDENLTVYPGHGYGGLQTTIAAEKRSGMLRPFTRDQWLQLLAN
ncbi:hypothetical protein AB1Y20_004647 [Prymnesium parvum]|uniref:Metallo-beta-lactamase domain-containing protein n=1 Tax=Prymnesium parvum TaxID=97485 RepID=A0AB34IZV1_PRYPA